MRELSSERVRHGILVKQHVCAAGVGLAVRG
jgi:hypothetical protein